MIITTTKIMHANLKSHIPNPNTKRNNYINRETVRFRQGKEWGNYFLSFNTKSWGFGNKTPPMLGLISISVGHDTSNLWKRLARNM